MDVLSDVLRALRLCGSVFVITDCASPWRLEWPDRELLATALPDAEHVACVHLVVEGDCVVEGGGLPPLDLGTGDVVVLPPGRAHILRSGAEAPPARLNCVPAPGLPDAAYHVSLGEGGPRARLICGYLNCTERFAPLCDALPAILLVRGRSGYAAVEAIETTRRMSARVPHDWSRWLGTTAQLAVGEAAASRPGSRAMLERLTEVLLVGIVREYMSRSHSRERGWLSAVQDPQVGHALRLLHERPVQPWTVDRLAHEVAMSRSALARRFTELLGEPPMKYLMEWRMHLAKQMLRDRTETIQAIAERIGYESEPAFSRAFKKVTGCPPATWRRKATPAPF